MRALLGREVNGQALPQRQTVFFVLSTLVDASGAHELCHVMATSAWGKTEDWINEGLAVYADDVWNGHPLHTVTAFHLERGTAIPLRDLIEHFGRHDALVAYPEAGSFVKFLYERYGRAAVHAIWTAGGAGIPRTTGRSLDDLEREWHAAIRR